MSTVCVTAARVAHLNLPLKCVSAPVALSLSVTPLQSSSHYELIFLCFRTRTVLNNASYPRSERRRTTCVKEAENEREPGVLQQTVFSPERSLLRLTSESMRSSVIH